MATTIAAVVISVVAASTVVAAGRLATSTRLRRYYAATLRAARWWMVPMALVNLSAVLLAIYGLTSLAPWAWFGWWTLLGGTTSNVGLGQTDQTGTWWQIAAFGIPLGVFFLVPIFAFFEESIFRQGTEDLSAPARLRRQLWFGFTHCVFSGVPLAAGLALTLSGLYFEQVYLRAVRPLRPEIEAAEHIPEFSRTPYPEPPSGPGYDADAWDRHGREFDAVAQTNRRRLDEWIREQPRRSEEAAQRRAEVRDRAVAAAAAAHAVSNAIALGALLFYLIREHISHGW